MRTPLDFFDSRTKRGVLHCDGLNKELVNGNGTDNSVISCKPLLLMMMMMITSNQIRHCLVDKLIVVQVAIKFLAFYAISKVIIRAKNKTLARYESTAHNVSHHLFQYT